MTTTIKGPNTEQLIAGEEEKQTVTLEFDEQRQRASLGIMVEKENGDVAASFAILTYNELWEHVHNCLNMLEHLGKKK